MNILAISGSAREASTNMAFLLAVKTHAPKDIELLVINNLNKLAIFSPGMEGEKTPMIVQDLLQAVSVADGIIISSPEHVSLKLNRFFLNLYLLLKIHLTLQFKIYSMMLDSMFILVGLAYQ